MNFNVENILVVGLGMIGSSIAVAAKSKGIKVNGIDLNENVVKKAIEENIIDAGIKSLEEIDTNDIDLIILAVPPKKTLELFEKLNYLWNTSVTITDTSSVKNHINLKDVNNIVLSHPIAGSERSGLENSKDSLFVERITVISPHETNENHHIDRVAEFWKELGSSTKILSSKDHDAIFAKTSHLPHVISYALMQSLFGKLHEKTFEFSGGSLEDYTRIASSDPIMWKDIFISNNENILKSIEDFELSIKELKELINQQDDEAILEFLKNTKTLRDNFLEND